jgi:hypothetical protein
MPFEIAIIKPNNYIVNVENQTPQEFKDSVQNIIDNDTTLVTVETTDQMMQTIVDTINLTPDLMGDTDMCYDDTNYIYQLCHLNREVNKLNLNENELNQFSRYLIHNRKNIYGKTVIIKSKIGKDSVCQSCTITKDDIYNIFYKRIIHKGILLKQDNNPREFYFTNNPLSDYLSTHPQNNTDNFRWTELSFLKFNLLILFKINNKDDEINKLATRLMGSHKIYGDVIITSKLNKHDYCDIDIDLFNKLLYVSGGKLDNRILNDNEDDDNDEQQKNNRTEHTKQPKAEIPVIKTKYVVLNNRFNILKKILCHDTNIDNLKLVCDGCQQKFDKLHMCMQCYRFGYHNKKCQRSNWSNHKKECLFKKASLNDIALQNDTILQNNTGLQNDTILQNNTGLQNNASLQSDIALQNNTGLQNNASLQSDIALQNNTALQNETVLQNNASLQSNFALQNDDE